MNDNKYSRNYLEFHILQTFPVTCLNRDDVGSPKTALIGGVPRARVSSQCWKRQVRLALHDLGVQIGIRTKNLAVLLSAKCAEKGADDEQAKLCSELMASALSKDTLLFVSEGEIDSLADYAAQKQFLLQTEAKKGKKSEATEGEQNASPGTLAKTEIAGLKKCLSARHKAADGLDIALFGRMVAQEPSVNVFAAAAFSHAISTHRADSEIDFFTALDDFPLGDTAGSAHMGALEYNSATYYRYISLDFGQLCSNIGEEDVAKAVEYFTKALYIAVPAARQNTQAGFCPWDYARILVRRGQRMQVSFDKPVYAVRSGYLEPSIKALDEALDRQKGISGSLYGLIADYSFGLDRQMSIDDLCAEIVDCIGSLGTNA